MSPRVAVGLGVWTDDHGGPVLGPPLSPRPAWRAAEAVPCPPRRPGTSGPTPAPGRAGSQLPALFGAPWGRRGEQALGAAFAVLVRSSLPAAAAHQGVQGAFDFPRGWRNVLPPQGEVAASRGHALASGRRFPGHRGPCGSQQWRGRRSRQGRGWARSRPATDIMWPGRSHPPGLCHRRWGCGVRRGRCARGPSQCPGSW